MNKQIKRQGYPVGSDDWLLKNGTGAAISIGDVVNVQIGATLDTAIAVATATLDTILAVVREACPNDATKTFKACVEGICMAKVANATASGGLLMAANASVSLVAYATDTKAANITVGLALTGNVSGAVALASVLFDGQAWKQFNRVT